MMAENIMWILKQEEARGNGRIFISGHNGHVKKSGNYDANNKVMGNLLADEIGNEYFVIGTDFYKTTCTLPFDENGKRKNYIFYSYDPMIYVSDAHPIEVIEDWKKIDKLPIGYYNISNRMVTAKGRGQFLHSYYFLIYGF